MKKIFTIIAAMLLSVTALNAEVIWESETAHNVANWNALQLPTATYTKLTTANAGDVIVINVTEVAEGARITLQSKDWNGWLDKYNVTAGKHVFVLTEATADSVRNGLIVTGEKYKFNKVELFYHQHTIWTTDTLSDNSGWKQTNQFTINEFKTIAVGNIIGVTISAINDGADWHQYTLRGNYHNVCAGSVAEAKTVAHVLNQTQVDTLTVFYDKIDVCAQYLAVSALHTYTATKGDPTAIDEVSQSQRQCQKLIKNGQLFIIRDDKTYTIQGQRVH